MQKYANNPEFESTENDFRHIGFLFWNKSCKFASKTIETTRYAMNRHSTLSLWFIVCALSITGCKDKKDSDTSGDSISHEELPADSTSVADTLEKEGNVVERYTQPFTAEDEKKDTHVKQSTFIVDDKSKNLSDTEKEARRQINDLLMKIQDISFEDPSDYLKAARLSKEISALFSQIGYPEEASRWKKTAETYTKQSEKAALRMRGK